MKKTGGTVHVKVRAVISKDGKTMTQTWTGTNVEQPFSKSEFWVASPVSWLFLFLLSWSPQAAAAPIEQLLSEVRSASFPELATARISVRPMQSDSVFFAAQFRAIPFLFGTRMQYVIRANSKAGSAPDDALRAVLAHELSHVVYYKRGKRVRLLGLVRLVSGGYRSRFERATDLEAIRRGYGEGLKQYRLWLYGVVPPKALAGKKKDYLSPEEIDAAMRRLDSGR